MYQFIKFKKKNYIVRVWPDPIEKKKKKKKKKKHHRVKERERGAAHTRGSPLTPCHAWAWLEA
jgi:hypothetical protein